MYGSLLNIISKINSTYSYSYATFKTVQECQKVQITMTGVAATERGFLQGTYSKSAKVNGKLTWIKGSHALWWSTNENWIVGNKGSIGSTSGFLFDRWIGSEASGLPYALNNEFEYQNGNDWVKPINEIFVKCTSLETVGK